MKGLRTLFAVVVLLVFLSSFAGFAEAAYFEILNSFEMPEDCSPAGLAWDGASLWMTDGNYASQEVIQLSTGGGTLSSFDWPLNGGQGPSGITWDGKHLRIAAWTEKKVYKFTRKGDLISSFKTPTPEIRGVTWDGTNLWLAGGEFNEPGLVHIHKMTPDGAVIQSFELALETQQYLHFRDLAFDGTNLWLLAQSGEKTLFMISTEGKLLAAYSLINDVGILGSPRGLTWDGKHLWVASDRTVYQLKPIQPYLAEHAFIDVATVPDTNADHHAEIAALAMDAHSGAGMVLILDGATRKPLDSLSFYSSNFTVKALTVLPDMNGNGSPEIGVLAKSKLSGGTVFLTKDSKNKVLISRFQFFNNDFDSSGLTCEADFNGNGMPEVTVIRKQQSTGLAVAFTRDALTGEELRRISLPLR